MPERTYGTVVTDTGTRLGVIAVQTGTKVNITTLAVGDGGGSYYQPVPAQTELKNQTWSGAVKSVSINEDSPNMTLWPSSPPTWAGSQSAKWRR